VKGLRRGEVAQLAGVSVEYYTKLERGDLAGASESVLDAVAGALQLDEAERSHLFDLARAANASPNARRRRTEHQRVRPGVQRVLDAMTDAPAWVRNGRSDVVATNRLGRALYAPMFDELVGPANTARFAFLSPRARDFYVDWDGTANDMVAILRAEAGRNPYDRGLTDLIGELSTRSASVPCMTNTATRAWSHGEGEFGEAGMLHATVFASPASPYQPFLFSSWANITRMPLGPRT
jgi:transcriptional regulator with XRE-family HTH domain